MANHRGRTAAPRAASNMEPTMSTPSMSNNLNLSEESLRKLPRSELQKLAMANKVKANMKSELIIRQLSGLQIPKKKRSAEDNPEEGPSRKTLKTEAAPPRVLNSQEGRVASPLDPQPSRTTHSTSVEDFQRPEDGPSAPLSRGRTTPTQLSYDENLFSSTESEMTEEEQLDYATPVSSRVETPPPANVNDIRRCITIMQEISAQDVALLKEASGIRENAGKLRKKARGIRDLVKAESARRERMEAYFRYWQEIEPKWDREWLYGEKTVADHEYSNRDTEPSTVPGGEGGATPQAKDKYNDL